MAESILYIYCDGGLGNRLNALFGGFTIARRLTWKPHVYWPINRWCDAPLASILDVDFCNSEDSQIRVNERLKDFLLVGHEIQSFKPTRMLNPNSFFKFNSFKKELTGSLSPTRKVVYFNAYVPFFINSKAEKSTNSTIAIKKDLSTEAIRYLESNGLKTGRYYGLHIRGTDAGPRNIRSRIACLLTPLLFRPVVLCTDDIKIQRQHLKKKSHLYRPKSAFPRKFHPELEYNSRVIDEYGRSFDYNIFRSKESIIEAVIDLVILTKSRLIYTSQSTFLENAYRFSDRSYVIWWICYNLRRVKMVLKLKIAKP